MRTGDASFRLSLKNCCTSEVMSPNFQPGNLRLSKARADAGKWLELFCAARWLGKNNKETNRRMMNRIVGIMMVQRVREQRCNHGRLLCRATDFMILKVDRGRRASKANRKRVALVNEFLPRPVGSDAC